MSFEMRVRALVDLALSLIATVPRTPEGYYEADAIARAWTSLPEDERFRYAFPFVAHQDVCEEFPLSVEPDPNVVYGIFGGPNVLGKWAEEYITAREAFYGAASGMSYADVTVKPEEFMRHLITFLRALYSVLPPWKPTKMGGLCRLGFYAVRTLDSYLAGEIDLQQFLGWLAGIVTQKTSPFTQLREAVYILPWVKRWLAEYFSSFYCETLSRSIGTYADMLFSFYRDVLGFLDWFKLAVIGTYATNVVEATRINCAFLGVARAAHRAMDIARECLYPGFEEVCRGIHDLYVARGRPSMGRLLYRYCRRLLETLFGDPLTFMEFYYTYYSARAPVHLRRAYMILSERSEVPYYAVRLIFAYLRSVGQWGYPAYMTR